MTTVTLTTRTRHPFVIVEHGKHGAFISGYATTKAHAEGRLTRLRRTAAVVLPVVEGKVTVELHECTKCGKPAGVKRFTGPGGICLECELAERRS